MQIARSMAIEPPGQSRSCRESSIAESFVVHPSLRPQVHANQNQRQAVASAEGHSYMQATLVALLPASGWLRLEDLLRLVPVEAMALLTP